MTGDCGCTCPQPTASWCLEADSVLGVPYGGRGHTRFIALCCASQMSWGVFLFVCL